MPTYLVFLRQDGLQPPVRLDPTDYQTRDEFRNAAIAAQSNRTKPAFDAFDRELQEAGLEDKVEIHLKAKGVTVSIGLTTDSETITKIMGFSSVLSVRDAGFAEKISKQELKT